MGTSAYVASKKQVLEIAPGVAPDDWQWIDHFANDMGVASIEFVAAASGEICVFRVGGSTGPRIFQVKCQNGDNNKVKELYGAILDLRLVASDLNTSSNSLIIIHATDRKMGPRH